MWFYMYDFSLLVQSTPGLLISLIGLLTTGKILEKSIEDNTLTKYHLLLQANCILTFKGNIELIYALYVSSMRQSPFFLFKKYSRYAFDNANLLLLQSIVIGLSVGTIGASKSILVGGVQAQVIATIMAASLVTCIVTTLMFTICLFFTLEVSKLLKMDPDNFILPTIATLSDYFGIYFLIFFTNIFRTKPANVSFVYVLFLLILVPICMLFTFLSKKRMPVQSIEILVLTYGMSSVGGYVLDTFSSKYKFIAPSFPVFSGLSVSISFIYLHKIYTSSHNNTYHDSFKSFCTLILSALIIILFYCLISSFIDGRNSLYYYASFTILFIVQVILLLKLVERIAAELEHYEGDIGVISLPLIASFDDMLSTGSLLLFGFILKIPKLIEK